MNVLFVARVIAMHEFDGIAHESAHSTRESAEKGGQDMLAIIQENDPDWARSYRLEIGQIDFWG